MSSDIIVMLVSPDFIACDYLFIEMKQALERSKRGEVSVIPILLRSVDWKETPLHEFQSIPVNGEPVVNPSGSGVDDALSSVANSIQKTVNEILLQDDSKRWSGKLGNAEQT